MSNYSSTKLHKIVAPNLTAVEYGKDIKEQFENIDDNFRRIANKDFVEGKAGSSVFYIDCLLYSVEDKLFTDLGKSMLDAITGLSGVDWNSVNQEFWAEHPELAPVSFINDVNETSSVYFYDYIKDNPNITVLYTLKDVEAQDDETNRTLLCSPQVYVFLDNRFSEESTLTSISENQPFNGLVDMSCILNLKYEEGHDERVAKFTKSNLFPTLYYDPLEGVFKWKIYEHESGIRATGPKGENGKTLSTYIVRNSNFIPPTDTGSNIEGAIMVNEYVSIGDDNQYTWTGITEENGPGDGDTVFVSITYAEPEENSSDDYVGDIYLSKAQRTEDGKCYVYLDNTNSLLHTTLLTKLTNLLNAVERDNMLGGLFVRYNESNGAHFLYSSDRQASDPAVLNIKPVVNKEVAYKNPDSSEVTRSTSSKINIMYDEVEINSTSTNPSLTIIGSSSSKPSIKLQRGTTSDSNTDFIISNESSEHRSYLKFERTSLGTTYNPMSLNGDGYLYITSSSNPSISLINTSGNAKDFKISNSINGFNISSSDRNSIISKDIVHIDGSGDTTINGDTTIKGTVKAKVNNVPDVYLGCPIGTIVMWPNDTAPDGWLLCNGDRIDLYQSDSRLGTAAQTIQGIDFVTNELDNLFSKIGQNFGGSMPNYVLLPDLQQKFPLGAKSGGTIGKNADGNGWPTDLGSGSDINSPVGETTHTLTVDEMPKHNHDLNPALGTISTVSLSFAGEHTLIKTGSGGIIVPSGKGDSHNNIPPFIAINFIIKYK